MTFHVLIPDRSEPPLTIEEDVFAGAARLTAANARHADEIPEDVWRSADALLLWHEVHIDETVVARLDRCRVIVRVGVGFDNVDLEATGKAGICVCNVPDYGTEDVADHAIALLLALSRGLFQYQEAARAGEWSWQTGKGLRRLSGAILGVVGMGRIGVATARRARPLGMHIAFYDPYLADGYDKALGVTRCDSLDELLASADAVTVHVPLTSETRGLVNEAFLRRLPPGALLINTARGGTMDLDAVHRALLSGHLRGAGLDVLPQEPPDPSHPLIRDWSQRAPWLEGRLVLTPHAAFYNEESYVEMRRKAAREVLRVLSGEAPRNCVNRMYLAP
jgi:D-3-phosphoglycerate dehydrogenase